MMDVEREALRRITPSAAEDEAVHASANRLVAAANEALQESGLQGRASLQGSIAKGTYLAGDGDYDLFLLMDKQMPLAELERVATTVAPRFLQDLRKKYAQHPYVMGTFDGRNVDLVPAYDLVTAQEKLSAVDRTPFHTKWVLDNLTPALRDDVRLAKRWLKGIGAYGAQTALAGFSGYLVEVLVVHAGGFRPLLQRLADPQRTTSRVSLGEDHVKDDVSAWVVVDPVDPTRNCAAAVGTEALARTQEAAATYLKAPTASFYFPPPKPQVDAAALASMMRERGLDWVGWQLTAATDRLDIVFPQFQRAARSLAKALEDASFPVLRAEALHDGGQGILLHAVMPKTELPATRLHRGPRDDGRPNAARFREKYTGHPLAQGPVTKASDGHVEVVLANAHRTPQAWLQANLAALPFGPHVQACTRKTLAGAPAAADAAWWPAIADLVLERRPWRS